ncbi:MAG: globin [Saprospiraceae bacterium]
MQKSLFEELGADNLHQLIDVFYDNILANPVTAPLFTTDINEVKRKQTLFLTQFLGGESLYSKEFGHPRMRMRHMPHKITEEAAINWLRCMDAAVQSLAISDALKKKLFTAFPRLAAHMVNS